MDELIFEKNIPSEQIQIHIINLKYFADCGFDRY